MSERSRVVVTGAEGAISAAVQKELRESRYIERRKVEHYGLTYVDTTTEVRLAGSATVNNQVDDRRTGG